MRAFVITGPGQGEVQEVEAPVAAPGEVVVDVLRAGVCGTDAELYAGTMAYLDSGEATLPLRIGHEWCGRVRALGEGVDPRWLGRRVTGDTMLGCGRCRLCRLGRQHLCPDRYEIGIRRGWPGALAAQLPVPASALVELPLELSTTAGAMVEPGANALRAVRGAELAPGETVLVVGPGTIGLLAAQIARAEGAAVNLLGRPGETFELARTLGFTELWTPDSLPPDLPLEAVIDASTADSSPALAVDLVQPGGRVVLVGLSGTPSLVDTRSIALKDATAVGVLSGSGGLRGTVELYAEGWVDPTPLVGATVGLEEVADVLAGRRPEDAGPGPKVHVDPTR